MGRSARRPWKCTHPGCGYLTKANSELVRHNWKHETILQLKKPSPCTFENCDYRAMGTGSLKRHVWAAHTPGRTREFACPICPARFYWKSSMQVHIRSHTKERQYSCNQYKFRTHNRQYISHHTNSVHEGLKPYKCTFSGCNFSKAHRSWSKIHLQRHESDPAIRTPFACDFPGCDYRSVSGIGLRGHVRVKHNSERNRDSELSREFLCPLCSKPFYSMKAVKAHINRLHTNEETYYCSKCEFRTKFSSSLKSHDVQVHGGKPPDGNKLKCEKCGRPYSTARGLQIHRLTFHSEERRFKCTNNGCNYKTNCQSALKLHLLIHEEKP